jgi:hypothetical protein
MKVQIYRTVMLLVVLHGYETWSVTGSRGRYCVLRERKWRETGENYTVRSFMMCTAHHEQGKACIGEKGNAQRDFGVGEGLKERDRLEALVVDVKIILKWVLKK